MVIKMPTTMIIGFCIMENKLSKPHVKRFVDRFKKYCDVHIFDQKKILEESYENWPKVNFLISFYHTSLPLHKVFKYVKYNSIECINDLFMQYSLFDRRVIYTILSSLKIKVPEHHFVNRCQVKIPKELLSYLEKRFAVSFRFKETVIDEHETYLMIDNNILKKPFVEKPVNAEDHNIYVYMEDGSVRKLFRKQGNVSSKVFWDIKEIRKDGSYIYEKFYKSDDDNDIKVYALGKETAYAETRKSPAKDGFVERDENGREKRQTIKLLDHEYEYARKITTGFNQFVCGFDIIRSNGVSYVMDVNGWSFVKNNRSYYDKCAELLKREIERRLHANRCTCKTQDFAPIQSKTEHALSNTSIKENQSKDVEDPCIAYIKSKCVVNHSIMRNEQENISSKNEASISNQKMSNNVEAEYYNLNQNSIIIGNAEEETNTERSESPSQTFVIHTNAKEENAGIVSNLIKQISRLKTKETRRPEYVLKERKTQEDDTYKNATTKVSSKFDTVIEDRNAKACNTQNFEVMIKNEIYSLPTTRTVKKESDSKVDAQKNKCLCHFKNIKKVIRVYRHGDRTPKQKLKVKMKATDTLPNKEVYINENLDNMVEIFAKMANPKLIPVINCLRMHKDQKGTKVQIKFVNGCAEVICKWGGVLTHTGAIQCQELADNLNYYISDHNVEIFDNMKIYSSSEGRVYESALEFASSFGNRVFEVRKDKGLLDETFHATELIEAGRKGLLIEFEKFKTPEDEEYFVKTFKNIRLFAENIQTPDSQGAKNDEHSKKDSGSGDDIKTNDKPTEVVSKPIVNTGDQKDCQKLHNDSPIQNMQRGDSLLSSSDILFIQKPTHELNSAIIETIQTTDEHSYRYYEVDRRWHKIQSKVLDEPKMSYNKISEINDNLKYDLIHNNERIKTIFGQEKIVEFYLFVRKYYRFLIENEYGMTPEEKQQTSKAISGNLLQKIIESLQGTGADIFFTKESRMYTLFNLISHLSKKTMTSKEFNYASYIGFDLYERNGEMRVSIVFSRGFNCQELIDGCVDSRHRAPLKDEENLCDISLHELHKCCEKIVKL